MEDLETVSLVIPCLNEEKYIAQCLDSILSNQYPVSKLDVLVVDGMSQDGTRDIVSEYARRHPFIRLLDNPKKKTPSALNLGIRNAVGNIIIRLDAHTTYSESYISRSVEALRLYQADNVGGIIKTMPGRQTFLARGIAYSISHPFGVGFSHFRLAKSQVRSVDTVPFGCFRRDLFERVGFYDENLAQWGGRSNEDLELNRRIRSAGGKIILDPQIVSYYYARGTLLDFWKHNFNNGYLVTAPLVSDRASFSIRHVVPILSLGLMAALGIFSFYNPIPRYLFVGLAGFYLLLDAYFSVKAALRQRNPLSFFLMMFLFPFLHLSYGLGSAFGFLGVVKRLFRFGSSDCEKPEEV